MPQRISPEQYRTKRAAQDSVIAEALPSFAYKAALDHLTPMSAKQFHSWRLRNETGTDALDLLYEALPEVGPRRIDWKQSGSSCA